MRCVLQKKKLGKTDVRIYTDNWAIVQKALAFEQDGIWTQCLSASFELILHLNSRDRLCTCPRCRITFLNVPVILCSSPTGQQQVRNAFITRLSPAHNTILNLYYWTKDIPYLFSTRGCSLAHFKMAESQKMFAWMSPCYKLSQTQQESWLLE